MFEPAQNSWPWEVLVLPGISRAVHRKHVLFQPFLCPMPACCCFSCPGVFLWLPEPSSSSCPLFSPLPRETQLSLLVFPWCPGQHLLLILPN